MIKDLVKLANHLDNIGEIKLASQLDAIIKMAQGFELVPYVAPTSAPSTALVPVYETIEATGPARSFTQAARALGKGALAIVIGGAIGTALAKYVMAPFVAGAMSGEPSENQKRIYQTFFGMDYNNKDLADLRQYAEATYLRSAGFFPGLLQQATGDGKSAPDYKMLIQKTFAYAINKVRENKGLTPLREDTIIAVMQQPALKAKMEAAAQAAEEKAKAEIQDEINQTGRFGVSKLTPEDYDTAFPPTSPSSYPSSTAPAAKTGPVPAGGGKTQTGRGTTQTGTAPTYIYPIEKDPNGPVHEMQRALGFTPDLVDGKFGRKTLEKYQAVTGKKPVSGDPAKSLEILKASLAAKAPVVAPTVAPTATETAVVPSQTAKSLEDVMMEIRPAKIYPQNYFIRRYPGLKNIELINNPNGPMIGSEALKRVRQLVGVKAASDNAEERINKMASEYESAIFSGDNAFFRRR